MSLRRALKSIIEWKNVSILYDSSLIKLLNDYDAFAEYPSSENVLSTMIKQGIISSSLLNLMKLCKADIYVSLVRVRPISAKRSA